MHDILRRFGWDIPHLPVVGMLRLTRDQDVKRLSILHTRTCNENGRTSPGSSAGAICRATTSFRAWRRPCAGRAA